MLNNREAKAMLAVQHQNYAVEQSSNRNCMNKVISTLKDGDLIKHAQAGNQIAFETLAERYRPKLHHFIARYFHDYDQQCDVLQQVLIQLYLSLQYLRTDRTLQAWLFQVAHNRCIDELRHKHMQNFSELAALWETEEDALLTEGAQLQLPSAEDQAVQHEVQKLLYLAISELPQKYRPIVLLRYSTLLSFREIGHLLHISESTAKTHFHRAKIILRQSLAQVLD